MVFPGSRRTAGRRAPGELYVEPRWYACSTRSRHEARVEGVLSARGVECYLPRVTRLRQWKDRRKRVAFSLFPGYVFGRFTLRDVHRVLSTPGVTTILRMGDHPAPIPDRELENVRRLVDALERSGVEPEPVPFFGEGEWVRIVEGPFLGVEGTVVEHRGRTRVLVGVRAIGQAVDVDVDVRSLARIARPSR